LNIKASIKAVERLAKAFAQTRTDEELLSTMYSAIILLDSLDEDSATAKVAH
jgi:hypothetical protein